MVHTEAEKRLQKQLRKEDRKMQKQSAADSSALNRVLETGDMSQFDPSLLRRLREEQLSEARVLQLYQQQLQSAYVGGAKILLPETMRREDSRDAEEIHIPPVDSMALLRPEQFVGTKEEVCFRPLIRINTLDEVAQVAFRNTAALNRIQSVVFEEAYETNDNLLICAPTGAGKPA